VVPSLYGNQIEFNSRTSALTGWDIGGAALALQILGRPALNSFPFMER
jgi:hypothetical protein